MCAFEELLCYRAVPLGIENARRADRRDGKCDRTGVIEYWSTERVHARNGPLDRSGETPTPDLRQSRLYLLAGHLLCGFVPHTGAPEVSAYEFLDHFRGKERRENAACRRCCHGHDAAGAHVHVNRRGSLLDTDHRGAVVAPHCYSYCLPRPGSQSADDFGRNADRFEPAHAC